MSLTIADAIANELKTHDFESCWVSSRAWNALKAATDGQAANALEDVGGEYCIPIVTSGRKIRVFCDPTLEDGVLTTEDDDEEEETDA